VTYTPLQNTHFLTARILTATVSDYYSTVPFVGSGLPRLYWRINSNPYNIVTGSWTGGSTYQFAFGNGVSMGDVVSYFIVCQDNMGFPNVGAMPSAGASGFSSNPPACSVSPSSPSSYTIVGSLSGIRNIPGDYPSLTGAGGFFADMNSKVLSGNLTVKITASNTEDGTNALNEVNTEDPSYKLTITNQGGYHTISGTYSGALIRFNGTDNVTLNGKGKLMIWNNLSTPSVALGMSGGCNGNIIDSCRFKSGNSISNPNNYNIYFTGPGSNNMFRYDTLCGAYCGLYINPTYWGLSSGNVIYGNVFGSVNPAEYLSNNGVVTYYQDNLLVGKNQVCNIISASDPLAIYLEGTTNSIIEKNDIHDIVFNGTNYGGAGGITLKSLNASPNVIIRNNTIRHIAGMGNSPNSNDYNTIPAGIKLFGSASSGITVCYNSVYMNMDASYGIFFTNEWFTALEIGSKVTGIVLKNNILQNSVGEKTNMNITSWQYAVYTKGIVSPFTSVNNNIYFTSNADNNYVGLQGTVVPPVNNMNLTGWQAFTGQDNLSLNADPRYNSVTDLTLQGISSAIGAGVPMPGIADDDILGNPRGPVTTIGAYEMIPSSTTTLNLTVMLEGSYLGSGQMRAARDESGPHYGSGTADHIAIELHEASHYGNIVYTATDVPLSTNGQVSVYVPAGLSASYYITIRHRNSLTTVSSVPVSFNDVSVNYAFDAPGKAWGSRMVLLPGGGYGIYGGDINQDGAIDTSDMNLLGTPAALFYTGYLAADVNGDGIIDSADMTVTDNNRAAGITISTP
jgi:hypothetical protein